MLNLNKKKLNTLKLSQNLPRQIKRPQKNHLNTQDQEQVKYMLFQSKEERASTKSRKPLGSSTNTRDSLTRKQKSYSKKQRPQGIKNEGLINRSLAGIKYRQDGEEMIKVKQVFVDRYYEKYIKKERKEQFPNISIIEEKESFLSNNQENSLDSLNNFIIQGNKHQSFVVQKSNQSSSHESAVEDWNILLNEYHSLIDKNHSSSASQSQYLEMINQLKASKIDKDNKQPENSSPTSSVVQKIRNLKNEIVKLRKVNTKNKQQENSEVLDQIVASQSYNQQKSLIVIEKSLEQKNSNQLLRKSQTILKEVQSLQSNISKLKIKVSDNSIQKHQTSDRLLQNLQEEQQKKEFVEEQSPENQDQEAEKDQEEFMNYMNKKYSEQNQPNLSLNNISKIMGVKPKQYHNKSIENQTEIKEKQDDEVVAMLENELRQKEIVKMPQTLQRSILAKQTPDNMCLKDLEGDIQNNLQSSQIQEETCDQNKKNFFIALEARQKWINSLEKNQKWKNAELALLAKMKRILHNPYIEFPED